MKGANSTFNTTDTSAARELPPAEHGADRPDDSDVLLQTGPSPSKQSGQDGHEGSGSGSGSQQQSGSSQGQHATSGTGTGSSSAEQSQSQQSHGQQEHGASGNGSGTSSGQHGQHQEQQGSSKHGGKHSSRHPIQKQPGWLVGSPLAQEDTGVGRRLKKSDPDDELNHQPGVAPTYVTADVVERATHQKPKGRNITEGDVPDDAPNASFTAEIGSADDPGRLAEQKMQLRTAESALDAGHGPRQKKINPEGQYDALNSDEPA